MVQLDHTSNGQRESDWRRAAIFSKAERDIYRRHQQYWEIFLQEGSFFRETCLSLVKKKNKKLGYEALSLKKAQTSQPLILDPDVIHIINTSQFNHADNSDDSIGGSRLSPESAAILDAWKSKMSLSLSQQTDSLVEPANLPAGEEPQVAEASASTAPPEIDLRTDLEKAAAVHQLEVNPAAFHNVRHL